MTTNGYIDLKTATDAEVLEAFTKDGMTEQAAQKYLTAIREMQRWKKSESETTE